MDISTLSTSIAVGITLGSGGYLSPFSVTNSGEIANLPANATGSGTIGLYVPGSLAPVSILNDGTIIGGGGLIAGYGVSLYGAGGLTNHGFIEGGNSADGFGGGGIYLAPNGQGSLINTGTILGGSGALSSGAGAFSPTGDYILNAGTISGGVGGGTSSGGAGIRTGGTVVNTGLIKGGGSEEHVILNTSASGTSGGVGVIVEGGTLINAGTIAGALGTGGTLADAVTMQGLSATASTLIVEPGAVFIGDVAAAPSLADVLEFASTASATTLDGLGTQFTGFSTLDFAPGANWTIAGTASAFDSGETISGFAPGDAIILNGFSVASDSFVSGTGLEITDTAGTEITLDVNSNISNLAFTVTKEPDGTEIETAVCYLRGTKILTPAGEVKVQKLNIGDAVVTLRNGYRKIKWIGRQSFARYFVKGNRNQLPVRIAAGALGPQLPRCDLFVSPGHSMLIGGVLVLAKFLVNGITITQDFAGAEIHYYQLEFETHDCVLAEGTWSESYADTPGLRGQFHNAGEFAALYPDHREPLQQTLCAPRPMDGPELEQALRPIVGRAADASVGGHVFGYVDEISTAGHIRGWAWDEGNPDMPVLLEILVRGRAIGMVLACDYRGDVQASGYGQGRCGFSFVSPIGLPPDIENSVQVRRAADAEPLMMAKFCRTQAGFKFQPTELGSIQAA